MKTRFVAEKIAKSDDKRLKQPHLLKRKINLDIDNSRVSMSL